MANLECNGLFYTPPTTPGGKGQIIVQSVPNATGQVTKYSFPWSGAPITSNVVPDGSGLPPITADKPYT